MSDETEVSIKMWKEVTADAKSKLEKVPFTLFCYRGLKRTNPAATGPRFMDEDAGEQGMERPGKVLTDESVSSLQQAMLCASRFVQPTFGTDT